MFFSSKLLRHIPTKIIHQNRTFFYWINQQFNALDVERKKQLGPDRTCAEWILRNGGSVKFVNYNDYSNDYNELPPEGTVIRIKEVDASNTSIMHSGFEHFSGCRELDTLILNKCHYVDDKCLEHLHFLADSLLNLQVSCCQNVTDSGLMSLGILKKLLKLKLCDLMSVKKLDDDIRALKTLLPQCTITTK